MNLRFTDKADKDYADLPAAVREALAKQLNFLLENRNHPSLQTKKYNTQWIYGKDGHARLAFLLQNPG